jgi:hypothetical protein
VSSRDFATGPRARRAVGIDVWLLLAGALVAAAGAWRLQVARAQLARAEGRVAAVRSDVEALQHELDGLARLPEAEGLAARARLNALYPPGPLVEGVVEALPDDVRLERLVIAYGAEASVELQVAAKGPLAYETFLNALRRLPSVGELLPGAEEHGAETRGSVRLKVEPKERRR